MIRLYLIDTNTISYIIKGSSPAARERLTNLKSYEVACVSSITEAELWYGLARIDAANGRRTALRAFLERLRVLPWGREEAFAYGACRAKQEAHGKPLGPLDTQIAAHAIAVGAILVSHDAAFQGAHDLVGLDDWATDL